ncbi:transposase [Streptomyces sp. NPDC052077]|uniref:transposase n=1 Tax=Streptomyces sp. NPDC052077 TaxID=3154757 RepID=UPI00341EC2E6
MRRFGRSDGVTTRPWTVDAGVWALIEPLLPPWPGRSPGPRPVPDRLCLQGVLYTLRNDIAWQLPLLEIGFGSGQTCWRRLDRWQKAGVFDQPHQDLAGQAERGRRAGLLPGMHGRLPHPREKRGRRHRPVAGRPTEDGQRTPPDPRQARHPRTRSSPPLPTSTMSDPRPGRRHPAPVAGRTGRPRRRLEALLGDKGYDSDHSARFSR